MSQIYKASTGIAPSPAIETIEGDDGSVTGSTVTIFANNATNNAGSSVEFVATSATTLQMNVTDSNDNTMIGQGAGNLLITGGGNTALGFNAVASITSGGYDTGIGFYALNAANGGANVAIGALSLQILTSGSNNVSIGQSTGNALLTGVGNVYVGGQTGQTNNGAESFNIYINTPGFPSESNVLRLGAATGTGSFQLTNSYISGINGNTISNPLMVTIDSVTDQLGVLAVPTAGITTIDGDTGTITGSTVTIFANNSTLNSGSSVAFVNSGTTSTLNVTDVGGNTVIGQGAGTATLSIVASSTVGVGSLALSSLTGSANSNVAIGYNAIANATSINQSVAVGGYSLFSATHCQANTAIGNDAAANLLTGQENIYIGESSGLAHTGSESYNVIIDSEGVLGESNTLRIGNANGTGSQQLNAAYIFGIVGNSVANTRAMTIDSTSNQLGTTTFQPISTTYVITNPYTVLATDDVLLVASNSGSPASIIMPATAEDGQVWTIKDWSDNAAVDNITITVAGGHHIDGSVSYIINQNLQSVSLCWSSSQTEYAIVYDYETAIPGNIEGTTYVNSSPYLVESTDDILLMDTALFASPMSVELITTPVIDGQVWTVKDWSGAASTFPITVTASTDTIDGASSYVINQNYQSVSFAWSISQLTYSVVYDYATSSSSSVTIAGDTGSISGSSLSILSSVSTLNCGSSVEFVNFGTVSTLNVTDSDGNTIIGKGAGTATVSGSSNTSVGSLSLSSLTTGGTSTAVGKSSLAASISDTENTAIGCNSLSSVQGGSANTAVGMNTGTPLLTGSFNTYLGFEGGFANTSSESSNIYVNSPGVVSESNVLRIGKATGTGTQNLSKAYISGIVGNTVSNSLFVTVDTIGDQLGTSAGAPISITGDTNSLSGLSVTVYADQAAINCGSSVGFVNSGTISTLNVTDAAGNTVIGQGSGNTAFASNSAVNTILGYQIMPSASVSAAMTAVGYQALNAFTGGSQTTAIGYKCLNLVTSGQLNTAVGSGSGQNLTTGNRNLYFGIQAGTNHTSSESNNLIFNSDGVTGEANALRIGNGTGTGSQQLNSAFISGIQGISVSGTAVVVSSSDQLGVVVSSRRYKDNIQDMNDYSSSILNFRPVTFNPKDDPDTTCPGFIAEEIAEIMPNLIVYDKSGDPQTVKYHEMPAMLLNELQKALARIALLESKLGM